MNGRTNRAFVQCGITFTALPVIQTTMRYEITQPIHPMNKDMMVFVDAYKSLTKPQVLVADLTKNLIENDQLFKIENGQFITIFYKRYRLLNPQKDAYACGAISLGSSTATAHYYVKNTSAKVSRANRQL